MCLLLSLKNNKYTVFCHFQHRTMCDMCAWSGEETLLFGIVPPPFMAYNIGSGHFIALACEYLINAERL